MPTHNHPLNTDTLLLQDLKEANEWVDYGVLVVAAHRLRVMANERFGQISMSAADNRSIRGGEGRTLEGLALEEDDYRLFMVTRTGVTQPTSSSSSSTSSP
jgi:hypothetical protein